MNVTYTLSFPCEHQSEVGFVEMQEIDVDFEISADITYEPAFISGPMDACYPDSSECDITEIKVMSQIDGLKDSDILDALATQVGDDKIINDLWEDYMERDDSGREDYEASRADQINDERKLAGEWE